MPVPWSLVFPIHTLYSLAINANTDQNPSTNPKPYTYGRRNFVCDGGDMSPQIWNVVVYHIQKLCTGSDCQNHFLKRNMKIFSENCHHHWPNSA